MENAKRDKDKILEILKEVNGQVITTKGCKIIFPVRFEMIGLASIGSETFFYGLFQILTLDGNYYAVHNCLSTIYSSPDSVATITVDDVPYYELTYLPGSTVITSTDLIQNGNLIGKVYRELINRGKVPYYVSYDDMNRVFSTAKEYTGHSLGDSFEALAVPISIIARNPNDVNQYYREILDEVDPSVVKPTYVPASSVNFAASSTLTKLTGSYFYDGVVSSLNNPTEETELIDYVLRY